MALQVVTLSTLLIFRQIGMRAESFPSAHIIEKIREMACRMLCELRVTSGTGTSLSETAEMTAWK